MDDVNTNSEGASPPSPTVATRPKTPADSPPRHKDVWAYCHAGLPVEITHHSVSPVQPNGIWCYYVYVREGDCAKPETFDALWLPDQLTEHGVTHDYDNILPDCEWHGGVTFYGKHGHTPGHRIVQVGCDFAHLWDMERTDGYTLAAIVHEANRTAELVALSIKGLPMSKEGE